jgi:hypothetical protein
MRKKMYILWAVLFVFAAGLMSYAQSYKMIITMIDGESIVIPADLVDNVSYIKSEVYSISWSLDNVLSSTDIESISDGMPFEATLTPTDGYYTQVSDLEFRPSPPVPEDALGTHCSRLSAVA